MRSRYNNRQGGYEMTYFTASRLERRNMPRKLEPEPPAYRPMTLVDLAGHLSRADDDKDAWRFVAEFLEEYRHEPDETRAGLLLGEPPGSGDEQWDVFLAALAEHLASPDGRGVAAWAAKPSTESILVSVQH